MAAERSLQEVAAYIRSRCVEEDFCLIWPGGMSADGVPRFHLKGTKETLPRNVLWKASGRSLARAHGFQRPRCDERCVKPEHQTYRSQRSLMRERIKRGRIFTAIHRIKNAAAQQALSHRMPEMVLAMRARYAEIGNASQVGREFNVRATTAWAICTGRKWKLPGPFSGLMR